MRLFHLKCIIVSLFIFLFVRPCYGQDALSESAQKKIDERKLQEFFTKNNIKPLKTASGLYYIITKEGSGRRILAGETVTVSYTGKLLDGTVFDSNTDTAFHHKAPFLFEVGKGSVIRGWEKGVQLLKNGAAATLYIPSVMAYGAYPPAHVPDNAILIFDMEITDVTR